MNEFPKALRGLSQPERRQGKRSQDQQFPESEFPPAFAPLLPQHETHRRRKRHEAGQGDRDAVTMSVIVVRQDTKRVLTRASLFARNLDLLIKRYVETLFEDGK